MYVITFVIILPEVRVPPLVGRASTSGGNTDQLQRQRSVPLLQVAEQLCPVASSTIQHQGSKTRAMRIRILLRRHLQSRVQGVEQQVKDGIQASHGIPCMTHRPRLLSCMKAFDRSERGS